MGLCWVLGAVGATCKSACSEKKMQFRPPKPYVWPDWPLVPRLLDLAGQSLEGLKMQPSWKAYECYVPHERRFVLAEPAEPYTDDWSYSICALACPCAPELVQEIDELLKYVPDLVDV